MNIDKELHRRFKEIVGQSRKAGENYVSSLWKRLERNFAQAFCPKSLLIKNAPVGVCKSCGTRYYSANVLKNIEMIAQGQRKAEPEVSMAVYLL